MAKISFGNPLPRETPWLVSVFEKDVSRTQEDRNEFVPIGTHIMLCKGEERRWKMEKIESSKS